jgi:serine/threonine protein phosphatase PrpC
MTKPELPQIDAGGLTHVGPVREENQDTIRLPDERLPRDGEPGRGLLYALADGMGGHAHGGLASSLALETLYAVFYGQATGSQATESLLKHLRRSVESANLSVYQAAQRIGAGRMGTTLTALHLLGDTLHLAHVGDSRAYLVRAGRATCLTKDHTTVGELVRVKLLSADKVRGHAQRSILNKAVGLGLFVQPDLSTVRLKENDRLVLCSDGVWSVIEDEELARLASEARTAPALSQSLINLALERETDDNVSAIAIHIQRLAPAPASAFHREWGFFSSLRRLF